MSADTLTLNVSHILASVERTANGSAVFNIWFAESLQDHLKVSNSDIIVNSLNPGFCISNFQSNLPDDLRKGVEEVARAKAYTTEEGSRFLVQAALSLADDHEKEKTLQGAYFSYGAVSEISDFAKGDVGRKVQRKLWVSILPPVFVTSSDVNIFRTKP